MKKIGRIFHETKDYKNISEEVEGVLIIEEFLS